jgi:uncharacterized membrane protein YgdD (TMEM256/DUF423 family)
VSERGRASADRVIFAFGAGLAGLGVALGAFGAHALRERIPGDLLTTFETGVRYQMYHALGLLALAWAVGRWPHKRLVVSAWLLIAGTLVFSGSLQLLALTGLRWLGAVTPVGGVLLIAGWALAAWRMVGNARDDQ